MPKPPRRIPSSENVLQSNETRQVNGSYTDSGMTYDVPYAIVQNADSTGTGTEDYRLGSCWRLPAGPRKRALCWWKASPSSAEVSAPMHRAPPAAARRLRRYRRDLVGTKESVGWVSACATRHHGIGHRAELIPTKIRSDR